MTRTSFKVSHVVVFGLELKALFCDQLPGMICHTHINPVEFSEGRAAQPYIKTMSETKEGSRTSFLMCQPGHFKLLVVYISFLRELCGGARSEKQSGCLF